MSDNDFNAELAEILSRPLLILPPSAKHPEPEAYFVDPDLLLKEEADVDVWISFAAAHEMTGLESYQITRAWQSGKVKTNGEGKNKLVHSGDLARFMKERAKNGR